MLLVVTTLPIEPISGDQKAPSVSTAKVGSVMAAAAIELLNPN